MMAMKAKSGLKKRKTLQHTPFMYLSIGCGEATLGQPFSELRTSCPHIRISPYTGL